MKTRTARAGLSEHPRLRDSVDGPEKYCSKCAEWWPADREFFFSDPAGVSGLFYCCKACYREQLDPRRLKVSSAQEHRFGGRATEAIKGFRFDGVRIGAEGLGQCTAISSSAEMVLQGFLRDPSNDPLSIGAVRVDCEVHASIDVGKFSRHKHLQRVGGAV